MKVHATRAALADASTLVDALVVRAHLHPDRVAIAEPLGSGAALTYEQLADQVMRAGARLLAERPHSGDEQFVVIALPNCLEYVTAYLGCLAAGVAAVTLFPPATTTPRAAQAFDTRLRGVMDDCRPYAIVGERGFLDRQSWHLGLRPTRLTPDELVRPGRADGRLTRLVSPGDLAMLQYTSGSTSSPRGVRLTHANLLHNVEAISRRLQSRDGEAIVSWLPLYHDMGLIGAALHPLWAGMTLQLFTPAGFVRRPGEWLRLASDHRAAILMAPNFAYELCVRRGRPTRESLDLSSVRYALNGAEPVRPATVRAFNAAFAEHGLTPTAMTPAYGLAENTVAVSFGGQPGTCLYAARRSSLVTGRFEPAAADLEGDRIELVGCGTDVPGVTSAVVDPLTCSRLADGRVGEIWVKGESVADGYHASAEETASRFGARTDDGDGPWLRTGDLGVRVEGQLCVCGRLKDLIIQNGENHDPADVEATALSVDAGLGETAAAFSVARHEDADAAVLLRELNGRISEQYADDLISAIRCRVAESHGLRLHTISLLRRGQIPRTTSGKVQRGRARAMWLEHELDVLASAGVGLPEMTSSQRTRSLGLTETGA